MNLQKEAEEYVKKFKTQVSSEGLENIQSDFIAGATSKYVEEEKIKAQIEVLVRMKNLLFINGQSTPEINFEINYLKDQLKSLNNEHK